MSNTSLELTAPWDETSSLLDHPVFLEASAGSGKTFTLERLVLIAVLKGWPLDSILGVTYTEKSAADLRTKVRKTLREARKAAQEGGAEWPKKIGLNSQAPLDPDQSAQRLKTALDDFSRSRFVTIHGFCQSVLTSHPVETGLPFQTRLEGREWEFKAALDYLRPLLPVPGTPSLSPSLWKALGQSIGKAAEELLTMKSLGWFRTGGLASATPLPAGEDLKRLWENFLRLEKDLIRGSSSLRKSMSALGSLRIPDLSHWDTGLNRDFISHMDRMPSRLKALEAFSSLGETPEDLPILPLELDAELLKRLEDWGSGQKMIKKEWTGPHPKKPFPDTPEARFYRQASPLVENFLSALEEYREGLPGGLGNLESLCRLKFFQDHVEEFTRYLDKKSQEEGVLTFDAMVSLVHRALRENAPSRSLIHTLRKKFRLLLIDEFQDTDHLQWGIFRTLFLTAGQSVVTVGDPKQGIYGFRGADLQVYLDSRKEITDPRWGGRGLHLPKNYRSGKKLVEAVNHLSSRLFRDNPDQSQGVEFYPAQAAATDGLRLMDGLPGVELVELPPEASRASARMGILFRDCAERLGQLHGVPWIPQGSGGREVPLGWNDMAVLVQTSREGRLVLKALEEKGIPATLSGRNPLFASPETLDLALFFQVLQNPGDTKAIMALGLSPLMDLALEDLLRAREDGRMISWRNHLYELKDLAVKGRYLKAFRKAFSTGEPRRWFSQWKPLEERTLQRPGGERTLANLRHILDILQEAEQNLPLPLDQVPRYLFSRAGKDPNEEETNLRLDRDEEAVRIMTLHGSKGLEFPVVYLAGGYSSKSPPSPSPALEKSGSGKIKTVQFLKPMEKDKGSPEKDFVEAEKRRLIYVALTRAKARVILALPPSNPSNKTSRRGISDWWIEWSALDFQDSDLFHIRPPLATTGEDFPVPTSKSAASPEQLVLPPGLPLENLSSRLMALSSYTGLVRDSAPSEGGISFPGSTVQTMAGPPVSMEWMEELGGKGFGTFYHEVLEKVDFREDPLPQDWESLASAHLSPREFEGRHTWIPGFLAHRKAFLHREWLLGGAPFRFASLESDAQWKEVDFFMTSGGSSGAFLGKDLHIPRGLLQGAIDLIFLHENQFWVLDWKTTKVDENLLTPEGMAKSMEEDGYLVQMGIYWTALRRMLSAWGSPYSLGGVVYAYLRHNTLVQFTPDPTEGRDWEIFLSGGLP